MGYKWEDEGAEFTYKGMLYDIINIYKSESGFIINALADAPEISLDQKHIQLAHQQKESSSKSQQIFKWVFAPYIHWQKENAQLRQRIERLKKFVKHDGWCFEQRIGEVKCVCGLDKAIAADDKDSK